MTTKLAGLVTIGLLLIVLTTSLIFRDDGSGDLVLPTDSQTTLQINNVSDVNFDVVFGSANGISVQFADGERPRKVRFFKTDGNAIILDLSDEWKNKVKRIIVPQGTILNVQASKDLSVNATDASGTSTNSKKSSFIVDTSELSSVSFNGDSVSTQGWGNLSVFDEIPDNSPDSVCSFGTQSVRNYCCNQQKKGVPPAGSACSQNGIWAFNNALSVCQYQCITPDSEDEEDETPSCGVGAQAIRDLCCVQQNINTSHNSCSGSWVYSSALGICQYKCYDDQSDDLGDQGDSVGQYCSAYPNAAERNNCCNDSLKNDLSTGPHPGFPDCIGKWEFEKDTCSFRCATYGEQIEIRRGVEGEFGQ